MTSTLIRTLLHHWQDSCVYYLSYLLSKFKNKNVVIFSVILLTFVLTGLTTVAPLHDSVVLVSLGGAPLLLIEIINSGAAMVLQPVMDERKYTGRPCTIRQW